ncbi:hypothetical protein KBC03_01645 [Patescibacteria group bacterium]|nr:hypothetical protein [Patescibacteria group bacterium]
MGFKDKGLEIFRKVVDQTKEDKEVDQKLALEQTKHDLQELKENVSYMTAVLEELKKTGRVDEQKFQAISAKLRAPESTAEANQEIIAVVEDIYARYDTLQTDQKEKIRTLTDALKKTKQSLSVLKEEISQNTNINYETIENELIAGATAKLDEHRYTSWLTE